MKFSVDRIEDNIVVLESIENNEIREVDISLLPEGIKEGSILVLNNDIYELDLNEEELRRKRIQEKFNRLKKK